MSNTIYMMEAANLFCGDADPSASNHLTLQSLKLPAMEEAFTDHNAGGARVGIEVDTHVSRLESTFALAGWSPQVMTLIGRWSAENQRFTAYGVIRDRRTGQAMRATAIMWGRLGRVNPTEFRRGDMQSHEYSIRGITHYELTMGQTRIFNWDFFDNTDVVGDTDLNAEINQILSIQGFTDAARTDTGGQFQV